MRRRGSNRLNRTGREAPRGRIDYVGWARRRFGGTGWANKGALTESVGSCGGLDKKKDLCKLGNKKFRGIDGKTRN